MRRVLTLVSALAALVLVVAALLIVPLDWWLALARLASSPWVLAMLLLWECVAAAVEAPMKQRPHRWAAEACIAAGAAIETAVRAQAVARVWFISQFGVTRGRLRMLSDGGNSERFDLPLRSGSLPSKTLARREQSGASTPGPFFEGGGAVPPRGCA